MRIIIITAGIAVKCRVALLGGEMINAVVSQ